MKELDLNVLKEGLPGITQAMGAYFFEAATVALQKRGHQDGLLLKVTGAFEETVRLRWHPPATSEIVKSWNVDEEVTEYGAIAISLLLMLQFTVFGVFEYSKFGTGIDFWMKEKESPGQFSFTDENKARLEVSGIGTPNASNNIESRIRSKKRQVQASAHTNQTAYIVVVEFDSPTVKIVLQ